MKHLDSKHFVIGLLVGFFCVASNLLAQESPEQIAKHAGFTFILKQCKISDRDLVCRLIVTSNDDNKRITVADQVLVYDRSRMVDNNGDEYRLYETILGNHKNGAKLVANLPTQMLIKFADINMGMTQIALLRLLYSSSNRNRSWAIEFRNIPLAVETVTTPLSEEVMNTELKELDGSTFRLADYRGRVILVNLWATWCGPCRSDIPNLVDLSQEFKARGVEVIGLTSEDPETDVEKVQDFVRAFRINYKIGWSDQSFVLALMQGKVRNSIPQSFVISRDGRVLKRFVGFNPIETPAKMRRALEEAVNETQE